MTEKWLMALTPLAMIVLMFWANRQVVWPKKQEPLPSAGDCMEEQRKQFKIVREITERQIRAMKGESNDH